MLIYVISRYIYIYTHKYMYARKYVYILFTNLVVQLVQGLLNIA